MKTDRYINKIKTRMKKIEALYLMLNDSVNTNLESDEILYNGASTTSIKCQIKLLRHELTALKEEI